MVAFLALVPLKARKRYETVNMEVSQTRREEPEPEEPEEEEPEPEEVEPEEPEEKAKPRPRPRKAPRQAPEEPDEEPPPLAPPEEQEPEKEAEEAPPVFDLGDNTFAKGDGQGAAWSLRRSEGNTKFAGVAREEQPSVRGTKAVGDKRGKPGGTGKGYAPVPVKNLSRRPKPKSGGISLPPYPAAARREGIEGAVVLQVFIEKSGKVRRVRVISEPGGGLGEQARKSMMKERWSPGLDKKGRAVDTVITYTIRFVLDG